MDYHWHMEYEIVRVLEGILHMTIDGSDFTVRPGGTGHLSPEVPSCRSAGDCIYQCIVFDLNPFLSQNPRCRAHLQRVADHAVFVQRFFSPRAGEGGLCQIAGNVFEAMEQRPLGYEMNVFGRIVPFFGKYSRSICTRKNPPAPEEIPENLPS